MAAVGLYGYLGYDMGAADRGPAHMPPDRLGLPDAIP